MKRKYHLGYLKSGKDFLKWRLSGKVSNQGTSDWVALLLQLVDRDMPHIWVFSHRSSGPLAFRKNPLHGHRVSWGLSITDSMDVSLSELWESVMDREAWRA